MDKPIIARREVTNHILRTFKLKADKRLGQNFLIDEEVVRRIVAAAELSEDDTVLEVGPGIGTLTQGLAQSGARVVAVELDKRLLPVLAKTLEGYDNVRIENGDILEVDIKNIVGAPTFKVAANLPYYITTPIIFNLLEQRLPMERLVAMVQKEVAERMARRQRLRRFVSFDPILYRAGDSLYRTAGILYPGAQCRQCRHCLQTPYRTSGRGLRRKTVLQSRKGGFFRTP